MASEHFVAEYLRHLLDLPKGIAVILNVYLELKLEYALILAVNCNCALVS